MVQTVLLSVLAIGFVAQLTIIAALLVRSRRRETRLLVPQALPTDYVPRSVRSNEEASAQGQEKRPVRLVHSQAARREVA